VVGIVAISVGVGALGFVGVPMLLRKLRANNVSITGETTVHLGGTLTEVDIELANPGTATATFGVQAAIVNPQGAVTGHLWNSQATAQQETALFQSGGEAAVAAAQADPSLRVATVQIPGGSTGTAKLYLDPVASGTYAIFVWAMQNPPSNALIAQDALGSQAATDSALTAVNARGQVTVG
jgi:hypothetical protein